jgi:hypothetical protein
LNNSTEKFKTFDVTEFTIEVYRYNSKLEASHSSIIGYHVPNNGEIQYEYEGEDILKITWPPIEKQVDDATIPVDGATYDVYITTENEYGFTSSCSLTSNYLPVNAQPIKGNSFEINLDSDKYENGDYLYITVIAHVPDKGNKMFKTDHPVSYHTLQIPNEEYEEGFFDEYFWIIVAVVILVLAVALCLVCRKYRKVKQKLSSQVREVRHADFGQEMKSTKVYNQFTDPEHSKDDN